MDDIRPLGRLFARSSLATALVVSLVALGTASGATAADGDGAAGKDAQTLQAEAKTAGQQEAFTAFLVEVIAASGPDVVDHAWRGDHGTIAVKPWAVEATERAAAARNVKILVTSARADALALDERAGVERAVLALASEVPAKSLAARYVPAINTVVVTAWTDDEKATSGALDQVLALEAARDAVRPAIEFEVQGADDAPRATADVEGGLAYSNCTGGFIGKKGSEWGILTAAHCTTKPSTYDGAATGATYVASNSYDVRFTTLTGGTPVNKFWNGSAYRTITATGIVTTGALLYKYGKTTGYGATTVESYAGCVYYTNVNATYCGLYYTVDDIVDGGDSGGPWFVANTGYAYTSGENSGGSFISPIAWTESIAGVSVRTS